MKHIYYLNLVVVGIPIVLALLGFINTGLLFYALISTMLTGLVQVIIGLKMLADEPHDKKLQLYIGTVILFFFFWYISSIVHIDAMNYVLVTIPVLLAIFLTYIIYKKTKL